MAEVFGVISGAVSTAAIFTTCIDCFTYIQLGRQFGRDFQTYIVRISCARLRLARWGRAINIEHDPRFAQQNGDSPDVADLKEILLQILFLFEQSAEASTKYVSPTAARAFRTQDSAIYKIADMDGPQRLVQNKIAQLVKERHRGTGLLRKMTWALRDSVQLGKLLDDITSLVESLEKIATPSLRPWQLQLARNETTCFADIESLAVLEEAAERVDPLLQSCVRLALGRSHRYVNVVARNGAKAMMGDYYSQEWNHGPVGFCHVYHGIQVDDEARTHLGNIYGGKGVWDD
ncbi:hypothetical protein GQ53DRAFT_851868 [Thozetella sp. PMI_491]|nr:hypothetical protein GQ53DRAFT_851868 [Thozetella sp. PMI_491]